MRHQDRSARRRVWLARGVALAVGFASSIAGALDPPAAPARPPSTGPSAAPVAPTPAATREALALALTTAARAQRARCGCERTGAVETQLANDLEMLFTGLENREGAQRPPLRRDWSLDPAAVGRCLRAFATALAAPGCRTVYVPDACDTAVLTRAPSPTMRVGRGEPCGYALCADGLECHGEEDTECVPARAPRAEDPPGSFCARPVFLPAFVP